MTHERQTGLDGQGRWARCRWVIVEQKRRYQPRRSLVGALLLVMTAVGVVVVATDSPALAQDDRAVCI